MKFGWESRRWSSHAPATVVLFAVKFVNIEGFVKKSWQFAAMHCVNGTHCSHSGECECLSYWLGCQTNGLLCPGWYQNGL